MKKEVWNLRVKYGHEPQGTRIRERLPWRKPATCTNDRSVFSSERAPHKNEAVSVKEWYISGHEPQIGLATNLTDWLTVSRNVTLTEDRQLCGNSDFEFWLWVSQWSERVDWWVRELPLLLEDGSGGRGQFGNPEERERPQLEAGTKQRQWRRDCWH
jgi:hypothetical protein